MLISIIVFDDFTDLDVFLMWDLLNRVEHRGWKVGLIGERAEQRSRTHITVSMHAGLDTAVHSNAVLFAGGSGARAKLDDPRFLRGLELDPQRQLIGSMGTGTLLLAALGVLTHRRAAAHPSQHETLQRFDVRGVDEPFICDGNVATATGSFAAQQLVGWTVERLSSQRERERVLGMIQPPVSSNRHSARERETHMLRRVDW